MRALFDALELGDIPQHQKRAALAQRAFELGLVTPRDLVVAAHARGTTPPPRPTGTA